MEGIIFLDLPITTRVYSLCYKVNIKIPLIPAGKQKIYLFPERVLVFDSKNVGAISYSDLNFDIFESRFVETERVPSDAKVVDRTWRYTNKSGGPDKRFKDNKELPVALYEGLVLTSSSGLKEYFNLSAVGLSKEFQEAIRKLI
jgi:hypothetical protein